MAKDERATDAEGGGDLEGKAGGKQPADFKEALAALAEERKNSAGRDRKISEYQKETEALRQQLADAQAAAEGKVGLTVEEVKRLGEISADLRAREKEMGERQAALAAAVERGVPVNLMLRGASDLDAYLKELEEYGELVKAGKVRVEKAAGRSGSYAALKGKTPFDLAKLGKNEVARIPIRILEKLQGGQS